MHVYRVNKPIFSLEDEHPARRFLEAFIRCRKACVGQELPPPYGLGADQEWISDTDGKKHTYSAFAYIYLSFDIELDGWLLDAPVRTESEQAMLDGLPHMRLLMAECLVAAEQDDNQPVVEMVHAVLEMLDLWEECIEVRVPRSPSQ